VEDVINGVREAFLDEGMDEQVLLELKQVRSSARLCYSIKLMHVVQHCFHIYNHL
jgi:hypothetical protein